MSYGVIRHNLKKKITNQEFLFLSEIEVFFFFHLLLVGAFLASAKSRGAVPTSAAAGKIG